jgi:hypothetical protein
VVEILVLIPRVIAAERGKLPGLIKIAKRIGNKIIKRPINFVAVSWWECLDFSLNVLNPLIIKAKRIITPDIINGL